MKRTFVTSGVLAMGLMAAAVWINSCGGGGGPAPPPSGGSFTVTEMTKTSAHPYYLTGWSTGWVVDGVEGRALTLTRNQTYTFNVTGISHLFYISTDATGGFGAPGEVTTGVTNSQVATGTLTFTPDNNLQADLYYQCGNHDNMGWTITLVP